MILRMVREEIRDLPAEPRRLSPGEEYLSTISEPFEATEALDVSQPFSWLIELWEHGRKAGGEPRGIGTSLGEIPVLTPPVYGGLFLEAYDQRWLLKTPDESGALRPVLSRAVGLFVYAEPKPPGSKALPDYIEDQIVDASDVIHVVPFLLENQGDLLKPWFHWVVPILPDGRILTLGDAGEVPTLAHEDLPMDEATGMAASWEYQPILVQTAFALFCVRFSGVHGLLFTDDEPAPRQRTPAVRKRRVRPEHSVLDTTGICDSLSRLLHVNGSTFEQAARDFERQWTARGVGP